MTTTKTTPKEKIYWAGFEDGKFAEWFGPEKGRTILFLNKKEALLCFDDVRKIRIVEVGS